ncbi:hypothetical protein CRENBAI_010110 [Crenichthys baileyi]|uniref:Uncharacterized protein n=1 Tax=Crenichthys baileyi TaxID=28760 RepID=A0AAV9RFS1_9TELE
MKLNPGQKRRHISDRRNCVRDGGADSAELPSVLCWVPLGCPVSARSAPGGLLSAPTTMTCATPGGSLRSHRCYSDIQLHRLVSVYREREKLFPEQSERAPPTFNPFRNATIDLPVCRQGLNEAERGPPSNRAAGALSRNKKKAASPPGDLLVDSDSPLQLATIPHYSRFPTLYTLSNTNALFPRALPIEAPWFTQRHAEKQKWQSHPNNSPPPLSLHLSHRPQLGLTSPAFKKDYQNGDKQGGRGFACSAPADCDTYLMQTPLCLPCLIRADAQTQAVDQYCQGARGIKVDQALTPDSPSKVDRKWGKERGKKNIKGRCGRDSNQRTAAMRAKASLYTGCALYCCTMPSDHFYTLKLNVGTQSD